LFAAAGADAMLVFAFTRQLAALDPAQFVELLVEGMGVAGVVTGQDFTFGQGRSGTVATLAQLGAARGMSAEAVAPVTDENDEVVSSSRIRAALRAGDCAEATRLLTRPFAIQGVVQHGDKLGRTIGFPTANIDLGHYLRPAYGIYAVRGLLPDGRVLDGAANLGVRPSFNPPKELLEPHFFDFAESLYDQCIEVQLIEYLRPEAKYDGLEALTAQIAKDCDAARQILAGTPRLA
jgi:riboflavin kinase/FMN adenylyltransferase